MTGGSYRTTCVDCEDEISAASRFCPHCGTRQPWFTDDEADGTESEGNLKEVFRRETITEAPDGGLLVGEQEIVATIDDVCAELESLRDEVDNPEVEAALRDAVGNAWRASVLHRIDQNSDIRMVTETDGLTTSVLGPDPAAYERERGESHGSD
ncbi:zinc ribbon domain-containing protein [Natrinema salifodinae]|uniref:Zinc-ribbon domain-containing protein n=1 Tax=Natrinema salifodinae TaxID=1202768 RepID=A0A1I0P775_9EURY|nr:zinc ribbon domain-containing protein [Natrinema salifodinae]SEW09923.1 hypothetical protein SAMN05216285_2204 [Natrinema salifodinae]